MSAYVVNKSHIDALLRAAHTRPAMGFGYSFNGIYHQLSRSIQPDEDNRIGTLLLEENVKSVTYRYPADSLVDLPGPINAEWLIPYECNLFGRVPTAVEALKLISCYTYQSCEHPEWETSEAKAFCDALQSHMINQLPGYDDAPWEWQETRPSTKPMRII